MPHSKLGPLLPAPLGVAGPSRVKIPFSSSSSIRREMLGARPKPAPLLGSGGPRSGSLSLTM